MTSRLKRKLNDLGVDPASSKANESFCLIGTPLPPLEKSRDTGEYVPLWKQEVRDEKGRRRLHGAFTGGFSAGYFNSVGSKEGWAPSTFVSSRSDRAKQKAVRPEDFMDDEDLAELAESRKLVDTHDEMDFGGTEAELRKRAGAGEDGQTDSIVSALEASLAPPPTDSVGARILRKMGWRIGQGIGPRLTYAQRKAQDAGFLDFSAREGAEDEQGLDEEAKKHMYPRKDTPVIVVQRKDNSHGIGYVPGMSLQESLGEGTRRGEGVSKGPNISAGFGLGALNDADEDDLEVYDTGAGRQARTRMAFDAEDAEDDHFVSIGSSRGRQSERGQTNRKPPAAVQTFNDGRPVLAGFVLSDKPVAEDRWFPLPDIPKGWIPNPERVWNASKNKENVAEGQEAGNADPPARSRPQPKTHAEWKNSFMSADERGTLLGETPLPAQTRSVFEYLSAKDRERLQNIRNAPPSSPSTAPDTTAASSPHAPQGLPGARKVIIPELHPSVAKAALQGFQPFSTDLVKQSRYKAFLQYQSDTEPSRTLAIGRLPAQSAEEFNKELDDYAKAATVFKPLSGAMAGRFRTAVVVENGPKVVEGLHQPVHDDSDAQGQEGTEDGTEKEKEDPRMGAVRLGMYGPLTRDVQPWQPAKLLCKRFGVKDPEMSADASASAAGAEKSSAWPESSDAAGQGPSASASEDATGVRAAITDGSAAAGNTGPRNLANVGLGDDETQGRDTLTYQRPSMDIFKAIFASDDEDSDDDEDANDEAVDVVQQPGAASKAETPPAHLSVDKPPALYVPPTDGPSTSTNGQEKVDLAAFKPTFVPRSERESRKDKEKHKDKSKKDKKVAPKIALSFDDDEGGLSLNISAPPKKEKKHKEKDKDRGDADRKRKKRKERNDEDEDDNMWVEAPPAEAVKNLPTAHLVPPLNDASTERASSRDQTTLQDTGTPHRGRKRAIDFM